MPANGSQPKSTSADAVQRQSKLVFNSISRYAGRLIKDPKSSDIHRFRTNSRRVEALVGELVPDGTNKKKLLKLLSKLRKRAGKLRDLDVQIDFLKELKIPDRHDHRAQLLEALEQEQARRSKKLTRHIDKETVAALRKRLRRARHELMLDGIDPMQLAFSRLPKTSAASPTEKTLHACRIQAKRARYLAELAPDSPEAQIFITELKHAQDEIGKWHDVLKLTERAEQMFGGVRDSALVAALQNISHARFRRAASALQLSLKAIVQLQQVPAHPAARKRTDHPPLVETAAA